MEDKIYTVSEIELFLNSLNAIKGLYNKSIDDQNTAKLFENAQTIISQLLTNFTINKTLEPLPQYHFNRDEFCKVIRDNYPDFEDVFFDCIPDKHTDSFSLFTVGDERYILHRESGTMINWYKNLGRTNTCNKPLDLQGLEEFILLLKAELLSELQKFQRVQRAKIKPFDDTCGVDIKRF